MTKEEFLNMVYAEIDRLKEEQKQHNNLIIIYEKLLQNNPSSQDYKEKLEQSKYNIEIIKNTIKQLNYFLNYPKLSQLFSERARIKNADRELNVYNVFDLYKFVEIFVGDKSLADNILRYMLLQIESSSELDRFDMLVTELEGKLNTLEKEFKEKFNSEMISRLEKITQIKDDFEFAIAIYYFLRENNFLNIKDEDHDVIEQALMKIKEYKKIKRSLLNSTKEDIEEEKIKPKIEEIYKKFEGLNCGIIEKSRYHAYPRKTIGRMITMINVPGITGSIEVDLNSSDNMYRSIEIILEKNFCKDDDNVITRARNDVQKLREDLANMEKKLRQNEEEIRKILGFDFDLFISNNPLFSDSSLDQQRNYNGIVLSSSQYNVNKFLNKVDNEAQNQADIREAELLGISLEELRRMKAINKDSQFDEVNSSYFPTSRKK